MSYRASLDLPEESRRNVEMFDRPLSGLGGIEKRDRYFEIIALLMAAEIGRERAPIVKFEEFEGETFMK
jgi:hypothetical protein